MPREPSPAPPYDGSYRHLFSHPVMVEHLLRGFVPQAWAGRLDFSTLDKCNGHYVADDLRSRSDDLVWRVRLRETGEHWLYVYLLMEFQSRNDDWMALRLLTYVGLLYQDLVKTGEATLSGGLPPVFPLVLYNGAGRWRAPLHLDGLMRLAPDELLAYRPRMRYFLLDGLRAARSRQTQADDDNLVDRLMQLERSSTPLHVRGAIMQLHERLRAPAYDSLRRAFTVYINRVVLRRLAPAHPLPEVTDLLEVDAMLADRVVEWTEQWKKEGLAAGRKVGLEEGRKEGLRQALLTQLERRFGPLPEDARSRVQAASAEQLQAWLVRVLDAGSLHAVLSAEAAG